MSFTSPRVEQIKFELMCQAFTFIDTNHILHTLMEGTHSLLPKGGAECGVRHLHGHHLDLEVHGIID